MSEYVLIVEDNPKNAKLLRDLLDVKGYRTQVMGTAEEGLDAARSEAPDLILMDIQLPGMDGITALRRLRADDATSAIPVVAVTASAMPIDRRKIVDAGFDGYLTKPLRMKEFLEEVRRILAGEAPDT